MKTTERTFLFLWLITLIIAVTPLNRLYDVYKKDYYWTNANMKLSLDEGKNNVEIYIGEQLLSKLLKEDRLQLVNGEKTVVLSFDDIHLRLNKKYEFTQMDLLTSSIFLTASFIFFILFIITWLKKR